MLNVLLKYIERLSSASWNTLNKQWTVDYAMTVVLMRRHMDMIEQEILKIASKLRDMYSKCVVQLFLGAHNKEMLLYFHLQRQNTSIYAKG